MIRILLALLFVINLNIGLAYGLCSQQFGFDTHSRLYQNGKLVGGVYRPKLGCGESATEYTENWILFKEFVRVGKLVNGQTVSTVVTPDSAPLKSLKAFNNLYKSRVGNTYVTSYVTVSTVPFIEPTSLENDGFSILQHEPDGYGAVEQNNKTVGAHWRLGQKQTDGSFIEYWVLTPNFIHPSHRNTAAKKGMILKSSKNKIYSYSEFLSKFSSLNVSRYIKVFVFQSKLPFDQQP
jgi:hypothetical protein